MKLVSLAVFVGIILYLLIACLLLTTEFEPFNSNQHHMLSNMNDNQYVILQIINKLREEDPRVQAIFDRYAHDIHVGMDHTEARTNAMEALRNEIINHAEASVLISVKNGELPPINTPYVVRVKMNLDNSRLYQEIKDDTRMQKEEYEFSLTRSIQDQYIDYSVVNSIDEKEEFRSRVSLQSTDYVTVDQVYTYICKNIVGSIPIAFAI